MYVTMTELGCAVAMVAVPLSRLFDVDDEVRKVLGTGAVALLEALGSFTILNYDELLNVVLEKHSLDDPDS